MLYIGVYCNRPAQLLHRKFYNIELKAVSVARLLADAAKPLEDARQMLRWDTAAGVGHLNDHALVL